MEHDVRSFGATARGLAKNPLGIIALFIVLVYGLAALVTAFASALSEGERLPLIWFLVLFPVLVLGVFGWLVCRHSEKLYSPSDFKDERNFLRTLRHLEGGVREATSISEQEQQMEASVSLTPSVREDSRLAIAQLRLDVERELFLLSRHALGRSEIEGWPIIRFLEELERAGTIRRSFAENLRAFVKLANTIVHQPGIATEQVDRCASVGGALVASLRHRRLVVEAERNFEGHGLWHTHWQHDETQKKYYFWSAVAASLPEFDYDFDVYREAAENHNQKALEMEHGSRSLYVLSLEEFVGVLEFREHELLRIIRTWRSSTTTYDEGNEWRWPAEWGDLGWGGPILRERAHLWGAEEDLLRTRASLARYRRRLVNEQRSTS